VFSGVLQFLPRMLKDQETGSGVSKAEEVDGAEAERLGDTTIVNIETLEDLLPGLGLFLSPADISGFMEYQLLD
jgi:hypothetical protein